MQDVQALLADDRLWNSIVYLFGKLPIRNEEEIRTQASSFSETRFCRGDGRFLHSRLAFLSDKAGKTRVVAIGDIISQSLLKPIHDHLFSILSKLPEDGTFDQDAQRQRVKAVTLSGKKVFCFDLTAATDRFPAILIAWALYHCRVLSPEQA